MQLLALLFLFLTLPLGGMVLGAEPDTNPDIDRYFAHPRATIVAKSGKTKLTAELSRNYQPPSKEQPEPLFKSGIKFPNGASVSWELVKRTAHGDVYLVTTQGLDGKQVITPVLFTGQASPVVEAEDIKVEILPNKPVDGE